MFTQLKLFDKTLYKAKAAVKQAKKIIKCVTDNVQDFIQTKIKLLGTQFIMCIPDPEGELDVLIEPQQKPKAQSPFSRESIQNFMQNIFNSRSKTVFY